MTSLLGHAYDSSDDEATSSAALPLAVSEIQINAAPGVIDQNALVLSNPTDRALTHNATFEALARPIAGPANPFTSPNSLKRKNVPTGHAEETYISAASFRSLEQNGDIASLGPDRELTKEIRAKRQRKGDASIVEGSGSYAGPWARYNEPRDSPEAPGASDLDEEADELEESRAVSTKQPLYAPSHLDANAAETSTFHGDEERDYQGRTYMHVPQDLDIDLRATSGEQKNYIPKKLIHTFAGHGTKPVTALRYFPNAGHILLSSGADSKILLWDMYHSRSLLRSFQGHAKSISDIKFSPKDGRTFISASYDRHMKLWDTETGVSTWKYTSGKIPHCIAINPASPSEFLVGQSDKHILAFDVRQPPSAGSTQDYDHHLGAINTLTFVDESRRFMSTADDKSLRAWEYGIPTPIKFIADPSMFALTAASAHPNGKYVAYQSADNQIVVYGSTDKFRQNRKKSFRGHNNAGYAVDVAISPNGSIVAAGDTGGFACFWDWKTGKMWHKIQAGDGPITCLQWAPQETSKVVTAGLDGKIKLWD
ncbi:MAG: hypothetical protein M1814_000148 [Vezdaea aestivalis]|nr:MAG: hypothetical protein M1814_000148 [Vezdaea aestivalis]